MNSKANDKKRIEAIKNQIIFNIKLALKIHDLSKEENELIDEILNYSLKDRVGRYDDRYSVLLKHSYIVEGVLYKHMQVKPPSNFYDDAF